MIKKIQIKLIKKKFLRNFQNEPNTLTEREFREAYKDLKISQERTNEIIDHLL